MDYKSLPSDCYAMNICHINVVYGTGSTGGLVRDLHEACVAIGESKVFAGRSPIQSKSVVRVGSLRDTIINGVSCRVFDNDGFSALSNTRKLINTLREEKFDIFHLHNLHGYYVNIELLFDFFKGIDTPVVWTLHDCWSYTGHCAYYDLVSCEKWKSECHTCPNKREYPSSLYLDKSNQNFLRKKRLYDDFDNLTIVTPSHWLSDEVSLSILADKDCNVITNGIHDDFFSRKSVKRQERSGKIRILGVAAVWSMRKGIEDFVRLADLAEGELAITLVGVDEKLKKRLPSSITCLPRTHSVNDLIDLYDEADYFFNPTYEETFGLVNAEAQSRGIPVISYNTGGCPETLHPKISYIVEKGGVNEAHKIMSAINYCDQDIAELKDFASKFKSSTMIESYLELYKSVR